MHSEEYAQCDDDRQIAEALAKAKAQADDPRTQWKSHDEVWEKLKDKYQL